MPLSYQALEDDLVTRLQPLTDAGVDVVALPDTQADYKRPVTNVRVTVIANSADFGDIKSSGAMNQEENVSVQVLFQGNKMRGVNGVHSVVGAARLLLYGYQPANYSKMRLMKAALIDPRPEDNVWTYMLEFMTQGRVVEYDNTEDLAGLITQITMNTELGNTTVTRDDELDGGLPGTLYEFDLDGGEPDSLWQ